jgi:signal transduction histidine kinase/CheY-like chemotaxis protein
MGAADMGWRTLKRPLRLYVAGVIVAGAAALVTSFPMTYPRPVLFALLLVAACVTSTWKVNLPIPVANGSTLSVSYAADLMALLLLGPPYAVVITVASAWTQCTFNVKCRYPMYRTAFSMAAEAITIVATGMAYMWFGGPSQPLAFSSLLIPLAAAIATSYFVNTALVAGAIALSTGRTPLHVWRDDFMWSAVSFMVAGIAGAAAAVVIAHGEQWRSLVLLVPVYLTYRTYRFFVARLEDQKRHVEEMRRLHEEALVALTQARDAERAKDQFLATVSHELRTPLNAILGWADMLRTGTLDGPRRERASSAIYDSARRQAQLVEELLDVARIMSGKLRLERSAVDLKQVVRAAADILQPAADAKRITLTVDVSRSIGAVHGDAARLQQVAWNLLANAVKFTPEGGSVRVALRPLGDTVELVVTDTGPGIPAAFLPFIFEPFRQADGSTTRLHGGLGLGLSIVKQLVEAHGGIVSAHSAGEGQGATFTVRMPMAAPRADQLLGADRSAPPALHVDAPSLEGLSVLVVDDDDGSRDVVRAHLESRNAVVLTAASAEEALDLVRRTHVDVLLADVAMPHEDGYALIRKLRTFTALNGTFIPAAALTAFARDEDRRQALEAGFQLHLAKPIDAHSLIAAVASLGKLNPVR